MNRNKTVNRMLIAKGSKELSINTKMANRHGLITGATGTGKTVTLQTLAENFSKIGVPIFVADMKGDLSGVAMPGAETGRIAERVKLLELSGRVYEGCPVEFWDVFGKQGLPLRTTPSAIGPLMLARILNLNETQEGVLNIVFRMADEAGLLLLDLKDLRSTLSFVADNASELSKEYGNVSAASIGSIQRALLVLEQQGASNFLGEPALEIDDFCRTSSDGKGTINILAADKLMLSPRLYAMFLLWLLSELYANWPEVGDLDKPKLVFFFDEAHLLFKDAPKTLLEKIEQVVRLVRSKGVSVFFVSQSPSDVPDNVLGQLGNRIQHGLRAFTPKDQQALKVAADTFRPNPNLDTRAAISELSIGEALVSFLNSEGQPEIVERAYIVPPCSQIGPVPEEFRRNQISKSQLSSKYLKAIDRHSAFEVIQERQVSTEAEKKKQAEQEKKKREESSNRTTQTRKTDSVFDKVLKSAGTSIGRQLGTSIVRGVLKNIFK